MTITAEPTLVDILKDGRNELRGRIGDVGGIRAALSDGLFEILGASRREQPLVVRASSFRHGSHDPYYSPLGRIRGALVTSVLRLHTAGYVPSDFFEDAVTAWRASESASELVEFFNVLDPNERAMLATDVTAHAVTLVTKFGDIPATWRSRTAVRTSIRLHGGSVLLRDHVDVVIGSNVQGSGVALIDVTTAPLSPDLERALRFHALCESLRGSRPPRMVAAFSTATGEVWRMRVTHDLLARAVIDLLETVRNQVAS